jgi:hypothetical protein
MGARENRISGLSFRQGNVVFWPVFTVAGPATIPVDDHIERQVTGQARSYRLCLYSILLKDNTRPNPDVQIFALYVSDVLKTVVPEPNLDRQALIHCSIKSFWSKCLRNYE